jgi:spermidine/putrescine transport system permease protein
MADERRRPAPHFLSYLATAAVFALLYAPLAAVVVYSFDPDLRWYERLVHDETLADVLVRSLLVASVTSVLASLVGTAAAIALERARFRGKRLLNLLTLIPLVMPELVLGLASVVWFVTLRLTLGLWSVILAHVTFTVSYVVLTVRARLADFDVTLEEAAKDLGATSWQTFRLVTLPLLFPGILGGAMMAFTLSFDDFLISYFTAGVNTDTLPMKLYSMIRFGVNREMYALSSVLIAVTVLGLAGHAFLKRRNPWGKAV